MKCDLCDDCGRELTLAHKTAHAVLCRRHDQEFCDWLVEQEVWKEAELSRAWANGVLAEVHSGRTSAQGYRDAMAEEFRRRQVLRKVVLAWLDKNKKQEEKQAPGKE